MTEAEIEELEYHQAYCATEFGGKDYRECSFAHVSLWFNTMKNDAEKLLGEWKRFQADWKALEVAIDAIIEAEGKRDPLATLGVMGAVKKFMKRLRGGRGSKMERSKLELILEVKNGTISWSEFEKMWEESVIEDGSKPIPVAGKPLGIFHGEEVDELKYIDDETWEKLLNPSLDAPNNRFLKGNKK